MSKYIIINADDFGYNSQQNAAIKDLLKNGLITSTSLMSVAPNAVDAVDFSKTEKIPVGVHLTLNSDGGVNLWNAVSTAKMLPTDSKELTFKTRRSYVRRELEAQYKFILNHGGTVDHADNHCATLYGINGRRFFLDAFDFCAQYDLAFRFPKTVGFIERQLGITAPKILCKVQNAIVNSGEKRGVKMLDDLASNPWNTQKIGNFDTLQKYYLDLVENAVDGITEIFLHPALPLYGEQGEWQKRVWEYEILKSGVLLQKAEEKGVKVVSWDIFNQQ